MCACTCMYIHGKKVLFYGQTITRHMFISLLFSAPSHYTRENEYFSSEIFLEISLSSQRGEVRMTLKANA